MSQAPTFLGSSIGKKVVMALSGVILFGYVFGHMIGNLQVYLGAEALNHYAVLLRQIFHGWAIWAVRAVMLAAVGLHIWAATALTLEAAGPGRSVTASRSGRNPPTRRGRCGGAGSSSGSSSSSTSST